MNEISVYSGTGGKSGKATVVIYKIKNSAFKHGAHITKKVNCSRSTAGRYELRDTPEVESYLNSISLYTTQSNRHASPRVGGALQNVWKKTHRVE